MKKVNRNPDPTFPKPPAPPRPPAPRGAPALPPLLEAHERITELKRLLAAMTKQRDHFKAELDADVEHILALAKERDELLAENGQLKRALEQELGKINPAQGDHEA